MAEACIGLALMTFAWILFSYVSYMGNNHIRTAMAARHAAWLQAIGGAPAASIPHDFFLGGDAQFVMVKSSSVHLPISESLADKSKDKLEWSDKGNAIYATVTFGVAEDLLKTTDVFPFILMKTKVPFMSASQLTNFLSVESHCAWPAEVNNTWTTKSEALSGLWNLVRNEIRDAFTKIAEHAGRVFEKILGLISDVF